MEQFLPLLQTSTELGLVLGLTALALFLSYSMLNVCDLSTDGCFALGAAVGGVVALAGYPWLSLPAAMLAGSLSGLVTAILQTRMGINSLLAGIIMNTALYSVNISIMGGSSQLNLNKTRTPFSIVKELLADTALSGCYKLIVAAVIVVIAIILLSLFLRTRMGMAIRATGDNPAMVQSSSINPVTTTTVGLCLSNALTALSGCMLAEYQKSVDINIGNGMVTVALASLLIGGVFFSRRSIPVRAIGTVIGAILFRLIYAIALKLDMPAFMLKAVSAIIVTLALAGPYLQKRVAEKIRHSRVKGGARNA